MVGSGRKHREPFHVDKTKSRRWPRARVGVISRCEYPERMVAVAGLDRHQERLSQDEGGLVEGGGRPLNRAFTPSLSTREPVFFNRASKTTVNEILKREILARKKASSASCRTILFCCYPDSLTAKVERKGLFGSSAGRFRTAHAAKRA